MTKQIRVKVGYEMLSDKDVATQGVAVVDGLTNNAKLPNPPINPADLKTQVDAYASMIAAAADGSKKAIAERKQRRAVVVKMLRQLGHWVEANCNDDPAILQSSGFQQQTTPVKTAPQPLDGPPSFKVANGAVTGQLILKGKPVSKAVNYVVHYAPLVSDGKPGSWTELAPVTVIRSIIVNGLTPGTTYAFQVRALGRAGYTNWSDSVTRMSM
jgi:Fibronectin type III domain